MGVGAAKPASEPDGYDVAVIRDGEEHRVIVSECEVSPELRPLIDTVLAQRTAPEGSGRGRR
jgi:hypothetical protein